MARFSVLFQLFVAVLSSRAVYGTENRIPLPTVDLNEWWGPMDAKCESCINDFTIKFGSKMIEDLKCRLNNHREFKPPLEDAAFEYGFNSTSLEEWITYVIEEYPFEEREQYLNQYPQYTTCIQGLKIHFIRVKSKSSSCQVIPLLMLHGWPGSVREFYETIPYIIALGEELGFAFDIIVPSLPGFGYSDGAVRPGLGVDKSAIVLRNLMHRLGYEKYYIQGGDMGSLIANVLVTLFPEEALGYHCNFFLIHTPETLFHLVLGSLNPQEVASGNLANRIFPLTTTFEFVMKFTGYLHLQSTRPDTVGIGLSDSPAGLMAYTMEKLSNGLRQNYLYYPDGGLNEGTVSKVSIIDNLMMYWAPNCITSAIRLYSNTFNKRFYGQRLNEIKSPVPVCALQAKDELVYLPIWLIEKKFPNVVCDSAPEDGGHFYAWEKPDLFAKDVVRAIVAFREWHAMNSTMHSECLSYINY